MSIRRLAAFGGVLALAVNLGGLPNYTVSVLAPFIMEDLEVSRAALGTLGTVVLLVASLGSTRGGRLVDRLGGRTVLAILFLVHSGASIAMSAAPSFPYLFAAPAVAGLGLALSNPVTNQLVALHIPVAQQGWLIGVKQAGGQLSPIVAGGALPAAALLWGWRGAVLCLAVLGPIGTLVSRFVIPRRGDRAHGSGPAPPAREALDGADIYIRRLTLFGFLMAAGGGMVVFFLPLYVFEQFGVSAELAGLTAAILGGIGLVARLLWGPIAGRFAALTRPLIILAAMSSSAVALLLASTAGGIGFVWSAIALFGLSGAAWNTPAMLAVIRVVGVERAGRSSGTMMRGMYAGGVVSPTVSGALVDATGSYAAAWGLSLLSLMAAVGVAVSLHRWASRAGIDGVAPG